MALLAVVLLTVSWVLVSGLNAASKDYAGYQRAKNNAVLNKAKQALIGYVAAQAAKGGAFPEKNPGALPCPEHPWFIDYSDKDGRAGPSVAVANPGGLTTSSSCTMVGRWPWRTIGTDKLLDAAGEPLWYVVSPGVWSALTSTTKTTINSNTSGSLKVDGVANAAVAIIIAPGAPMSVAAASGCT